ncbi:nickel-responsive transcriptional regulator NikR [Celerinatantimonas sp. YJH-8]|uniref:nickel-responsive transcriptional regulator NikR n=1 Tax=Celerinatantimonas sp. YJH-8 TaxID=3228714 RepID=UPI0038BEE120
MALERISISLDEDLIELFERSLRQHGYRNRSEAIRDLIRDWLENEHIDAEDQGISVGTLTYIYDHEERQLANRVLNEHHAHHDVVVSTTHIHLDHDNCLETVILRGTTQQVKNFADMMIAMPGIRHGKLYLVQAEEDPHSHSHDHSAASHHHIHPRT